MIISNVYFESQALRHSMPKDVKEIYITKSFWADRKSNPQHSLAEYQRTYHFGYKGHAHMSLDQSVKNSKIQIED